MSDPFSHTAGPLAGPLPGPVPGPRTGPRTGTRTAPCPGSPAGSVPATAAGREPAATVLPPRIAEPREVAPADARELSRLFFRRLHELDEDTPEYRYVRETLVEMNCSLVQFAVRPFRGRADGVDLEDLVQVGTIGLIKAIDRFDPAREVEFASLAMPYITGEIKRHFRDTSWAVRVPRRLQELRIGLAKAKEDLTALLDRPPTVADLAAHLSITEEEVIEGLVAANGHTSGSLDAPHSEHTDGPADGHSLAETMGAEEPALGRVEDIQTLAPLLERLSDRERRMLSMRFGEELTQAQIGAALGISQMQVSRLLTRVLAHLRASMLADPEWPGAAAPQQAESGCTGAGADAKVDAA
ncbi:SigB/SigF/SigG family RNA polymerase sigma factor [Streptomyces sp. H27-H1]|uniref:SigB/SigF/SigG family RNA polymerase sigma factor n=1 Tax=Streptomyces sp. H27-H1 TaxID=2996461 RepID=UPI003B639BE8